MFFLKKFFLILGAAAAVVMASGCSATEKIADTNDYTVHGELNITMSISETEITSDTDSLTLVYKYTGTADDAMYGFGCDYTLERLENGSWYIIPFSENAMFDDLGYLLGSESSNQFTNVSLDPNFYNEKLTKGTYRVVKPIEEDLTLTAEFEIE